MLRALIGGLILAAAGSVPDLALEVGLEKETVGFGEAVPIKTRLVNRGDGKITYYEPDGADIDCFPAIRLVRAGDGAIYHPWNAPYQTMVSPGLVGALVTLGPGESRAHSFRPARFVPEEGGAWGQPVRLPPGEYRVEAVYEKKDDLVPWNTGGFDEKLRAEKGLFTGRVEAAPAKLVVGPPDRPWLRLVQADGKRAVLLAVFENPLSEPATFAGSARLAITSKMYGSAVAEGALPTPVTVPAGGRTEVPVDLERLTFEARGDRFGLRELVPAGLCHFALALVDSAGKETAAADGIFATVPPLAAAGIDGLVVNLSAEGPPGKVRVAVTNLGPGSRRIVSRLAFPVAVLLRIEDPDGKRATGLAVQRSASLSHDGLRPTGGEEFLGIASGLAFDGDRFEKAPGLTVADFRAVEPGASMERTLDLDELVAGGLPAGKWRIRAAWRNVEPGWRLGFEEPAPVGVVWSEAIELTIPGR